MINIKLIKTVRSPKLVRIDLDKPIMRLVGKTDHRTLGIWAADCAKRVLPLFEKKHPKDDRPRKAIEALQKWIKTGAFKMSDIRSASLAAHAAAREVKADNTIACSAARSAGQAVATAHVPTHAIGAAVYAATAVRDATAFRSTPKTDDPAAATETSKKERDWQYRRLLKLYKAAGKHTPAKQKLWRG